MSDPRSTIRVAAALLLCTFVATAEPVATSLSRLPLAQNGGTWPSGHVQGIAVDVQGGYLYYSFTDLLAKYDFSGRLIGTLVGWTGHLGDLDFNPADGKLYGSLEYKEDRAFYIALIDAGRIDRPGIEAGTSDVFRTVHLAEVASDYGADLDGDGRLDDTVDRRYGCSGIDGVGFGPAFGQVDGPRYLTVAYGIYGNTAREDNDHQVLLQYDVSDWHRYARPLDEAKPHRSGPTELHGKYFVRTGNTTWGVQNLSYDESLQRWFMGVYRGRKPSFPNYLLFAIDARTQPQTGDLVGVPAADGKQKQLLELADDGLKDAATGVRGWNQKADVGFQPVGAGLFFVSVNSGSKRAQTADLTLMRWTGDATRPFVPVTGKRIP
ncbi:MAG TPA: hypothetical protein PKE27_14885 [Povalibacter sp.]|uniref:hypothetical protein n=1 Tax=Povalibacter sp. TaxID=1962978 RepID=UPI002CB51BE9|nr:hypothetical protein [Povalibacter sp.]HMN45861.1 hypothetical protein [Povalibacter sp.]